ncbi:hypothetical protein J6590_083623 [Homalodisca vitripennis]|nr:hypothetical protein J6590_083623 [Homalodisca vitripennis]
MTKISSLCAVDSHHLAAADISSVSSLESCNITIGILKHLIAENTSLNSSLRVTKTSSLCAVDIHHLATADISQRDSNDIFPSPRVTGFDDVHPKRIHVLDLCSKYEVKAVVVQTPKNSRACVSPPRRDCFTLPHTCPVSQRESRGLARTGEHTEQTAMWLPPADSIYTTSLLRVTTCLWKVYNHVDIGEPDVTEV